MKILAVDVGDRTQDIMLYDPDINIENCVKAVLPTPSSVYAGRISKLANPGNKSIFISGDCIGGGKLSKAIADAAARGRVCMTQQAARTISYKNEEIEKLGIRITDEFNADCEVVFTESDLGVFENFLSNYDICGIDAVCYAVQDHGARWGIANREYRFEVFTKMLKKHNKLMDFSITGYDQIDSSFYRFKSLFNSLKRQKEKVLIMDTAQCALLGCTADDSVKNLDDYMIINLGNGHATFAIMRGGRIISYMEHHTRYLHDGQKLKDYIVRFADGNLESDEVFNDGGSGAVIFETVGFENLKKIVVTGPWRSLVKNTSLEYYFASPAGDMMMSGPAGLVSAYSKVEKI